jgi:hypothetical protein
MKLYALTSLLFAAGAFTATAVKGGVRAKQDTNIEHRFLPGKNVVANVHVAGTDAGVCIAWGLPPNCDANFSLSARKYADGTVKGQWQDTVKGETGLHIEIDCLKISVDGTSAIVSGIIKQGFSGGNPDYATGCTAVTRFIDGGGQGTDMYSYTYATCDSDVTCDTLAESSFDMFEHVGGQVKIKVTPP